MNNSKYLILTMGGSGTRFGASIPKQFTDVDGKPIFAYLLEKINNSNTIDKIVLVVNKDYLDFTSEWVEKINADKVYAIVKNGDTRTRSVVNGLNALKDIADYDDVVLIHDATHPYFDEEAVKEVINGVNEYGAATVVSNEYDTVYRSYDEKYIDEEIPKKQVLVGASPEAIKYGIISEIYEKATEEELNEMSSVGAIAIRKEIPLYTVPTKILNIKITHPCDMELFRLLVHSYFFKEEEREMVKERRLL